MRTAGILGGMGPLATVDFLRKVVERTPAQCDQEHLPLIVLSIPQIPDRTTAILSGGEDPLPALLEKARMLEAMGAGFIAIPCNTAHYWHGALQQQLGIPILHIVDAVVTRLQAQAVSPGRIGLLATDGTVAAGVYTHRLQEHGYELVLPEASSQAQIMEAIQAIKAGQIEAGRAGLVLAARHLLQQGCRAIVLGCTEIPVGLAEARELLPHCIDATEALADATIAVARQ